MSYVRRAAAPRLIDWTGERCVPWAPDVQVVYEHLHRYLWAAEIVEGRSVLDLGSGEGFGAAMLARGATRVVGLEIDVDTVEHSRLNYEAANLEFRLGSAVDLSSFPDDSFDVVVAFELVEHVAEQSQMLAEVTRVLTADGVLIMSTPDRRTYSDAPDYANPFHVRELTLDEFRELLGERFEHVSCWSQRAITGSRIGGVGGPAPDGADATGSDASLESPAGGESAFLVERSGEEWRLASEPAPFYLIAVASGVPLPQLPATSLLADFDLTLMREAERRGVQEASAAQARVGELRAERDALLAAHRELHERLRSEVGAAHAQLQALHRERALLAQALRDQTLRSRAELEHLDVSVERAQASAASLTEQLAALESEVAPLRAALARTEESVTWRVFQRVRRRFYGVIGERTILARLFGLTLRLVGRAVLASPSVAPAPVAPAPPATAPDGVRFVRFPEYERPLVSLVIPCHARADLTEACLRSIVQNTPDVDYEVIIVDDASDPQSKFLFAHVRGATILVSDTNLGYLRSVNRGAAAARGEWLVLFNNDTEVRPGWLSAMLACAESAPDIGVVTPRYVYPDGRLCEAGGIIWRDGTGMNFGRGDPPNLSAYEYRRETDYGSAAALLVRADLFRDVGGYDERYLPLYYEDADLCFSARERGLRVMYEPEAIVVHHEGATAGVDLTSGHKRHQEDNRPKFVEKWRQRLETEHMPSDSDDIRGAADRNRGRHVLIIDHKVPAWDRDAGSVRMLGVLKALLSLGCRVTFMPDNFTVVEPYTRELRRMGVEVLTVPIDVRAELRAIGPFVHTAILARPLVASRWLDSVREVAPQATAIYDTVDLHWLRESRRATLNGSGAALASKSAALRELELAMVRATDVTLVVTEDERRLVEADVPSASVFVLPMVHDVATDVSPATGRAGVLFVGGFEHDPNIDAAVRLVEEVMPLVWRELPDVPVTVVGADAPPEVERLASRLVDVTGWVEDLEPLIDGARAMVAPLRYGAGLKGKVTQSLAAGLPVVTTTVGAEGLDVVDGEHMLIADDPAEMAERIVRVLGDDELWHRLSVAGQAVVDAMCSPAVIVDRLEHLLAGEVAPREQPASTG